MPFDGLHTNFFMPFVVMIAVCCQSHKNLNCSIKSPPTTALENIKSSGSIRLCVFTFLLIQHSESQQIKQRKADWVALKLFRTLQQKKLKCELEFYKWIFNCTSFGRVWVSEHHRMAGVFDVKRWTFSWKTWKNVVKVGMCLKGINLLKLF